MLHVLVFSFLALLDPVLAAATAAMLLLPNPKRLMRSFVLGGLITSITVGLLIVFSLQDSAVVSTTKHTIDPVAYIALGGIFLLASIALATGLWARFMEWRRRRERPKKDKGPSRLEQTLDKGSPRLTFAVGAVYEALPSVYFLGAMAGIISMNRSTVPTVLLVALVCVLQLTLVLVPLISFAVAPDWTPKALHRLKAWFVRDTHRIAVIGTALAGLLLVARGLIVLSR